MISDERMEKALHFLVETDRAVAEAEGAMLRAEYHHELVVDRALLLSGGGSVADRKASAAVSQDAQDAHERYLTALVELKALRAKRETEAQVIGVWRTQESSRRVAG